MRRPKKSKEKKQIETTKIQIDCFSQKVNYTTCMKRRIWKKGKYSR
jgi:hypothetical protein